jgi:predicted dehydrogenase
LVNEKGSIFSMEDNQGSNEPLTVALLGAGQVAQHHCQAFAGLGAAVKITGIADTDLGRAQALAATCGAQAHADYRALLAARPALVVICLPHHLHCEAGVAAAEAGCHVLMEKPLAPTLEEARTIVDACRQHNVLLTVSFVHRYRTEFQQAHRLIQAGQIGQVEMIVDLFGLPGGRHIPGWVWRERREGGGILMYSGIHSLDWQRWLVGSDVVRVYAHAQAHGPANTDAESSLVATLHYANGVIGSLIGNQPAYRVTPRTRTTEIYGSQGCLRLRSGETLDYSDDHQSYRSTVERDDPFVTQAREFTATVREQRAPWITGEDGLRAQQLCLAIYRSAELGRPVDIDEDR